jgi:hypothetical protein
VYGGRTVAQAICQTCSTEFKFKIGSSTGKYCSLICTKTGQAKERRQNFLEGKMVNRGWMKNHMVDIHGWQCMCCKHKEWMGVPIPLELDHIDGNAGNNHPDNLRLLCPTCHALTPTHKAKNKGNGRGSRGLPWY